MAQGDAGWCVQVCVQTVILREMELLDESILCWVHLLVKKSPTITFASLIDESMNRILIFVINSQHPIASKTATLLQVLVSRCGGLVGPLFRLKTIFLL